MTIRQYFTCIIN